MNYFYWVALVLTLIFAITHNAKADSLDIIVGSEHYANDGYWDDTGHHDYNQHNPGLAYNHDSGWSAGAYNNSYHKQSLFVGYRVETNYKYINAGMMGGLVTGYHGQTNQRIKGSKKGTNSLADKGLLKKYPWTKSQP